MSRHMGNIIKMSRDNQQKVNKLCSCIMEGMPTVLFPPTERSFHTAWFLESAETTFCRGGR